MSSKYEKRLRYVKLIRVLITFPLMFIIILRGGLFSPTLSLLMALLLIPIALYDIALPIYLAAFIAYWGFTYHGMTHFLFTTAYMVLGLALLFSPTAFILFTISYIILLISPENYWISLVFIPLLIGLEGSKVKGSTIAFTALLLTLFICYGVFVAPLPILFAELKAVGPLTYRKPPLNTFDPWTIYKEVLEARRSIILSSELIVKNMAELDIIALTYGLIIPWTVFTTVSVLIVSEYYDSIRKFFDKVFKGKTPAVLAARCFTKAFLGCLIIGVGLYLSLHIVLLITGSKASVEYLSEIVDLIPKVIYAGIILSGIALTTSTIIARGRYSDLEYLLIRDSLVYRLTMGKPKPVKPSRPKIEATKTVARLRKPFPTINIKGYELIEPIGSGGFSLVYRARRLSDNSIVAIKIPNIALYETLTEDEISSFLHEAEIWSKLKHKNIVKVLEYGAKPLPYIVMEFCDQGNLRELMKKKELTLGEKLRIAYEVADALSFAHHMGVIHRDIKPENVLFKNNTAKLTDFGIAKALLEASSRTSAGIFKGTLAYAAPEQIDPTTYGQVDWRTDIWQYGIMLYELLTGKLPFEAETPAALINNILNKQPEPPSKINPEIPPEIDEIILKCLAKRKEERTRSIDIIIEKLEKII